MTMKSLTGSAGLKTILNRLGHGLSYTKVEEEETERAERQIRSQQDGELTPCNCYQWYFPPSPPQVFPQFAWNNDDLEECTASGSGTTHCTNGIVVPKVPDCCENKPSDIDILNKIAKRDSKRSLDRAPVQILPYSGDLRQGSSNNSVTNFVPGF